MPTVFNPNLGVEHERNLSWADGSYIKDMEIPESFWNLIGKAGKKKLDQLTRKPTGVKELKINNHPELDIVPDTGYGEVEFAMPVETNLLNAKKHQEEAFAMALDVAHAAVWSAVRNKTTQGIVMLGIGKHPFLQETTANYFRLRAPKGHLYSLICEGSKFVKGRGWDHRHYLTVTSDQPNIDLPPGFEFKMIQALNRLSPFLVAMSANSPFSAGKLTAYKSCRQFSQFKVLKTARFKDERTLAGMPETEPDSFHWYIKKMFENRPMMFYGNGKDGDLYVIKGNNNTPPSLIDFIKSEKSFTALNVEGKEITVASSAEDIKNPAQRVCFFNAKPQFNFSHSPKFNKKDLLKAYENHELDRFFLDHQVKIYTEIRPLDSALPGMEYVMPALIKGLVINYEKTFEFIFDKKMVYSDLLKAYFEAARFGLDFRFNNKKIADYCTELMTIALDGLGKVNGGKEKSLLAPLQENLKKNLCPADYLINAYNKSGFASVIKLISIK